MRWAFAALVAIHALIHLLGFAKAFGFARVLQLTQPIPRPLGVLWLMAALAMLAAIVALFAWPTWWWAIGAVALIVSQTAITSSWADAKFGSLANVLVLVGVVYGFLTAGPWSFRAAYDHRLGRRARTCDGSLRNRYPLQRHVHPGAGLAAVAEHQLGAD